MVEEVRLFRNPATGEKAREVRWLNPLGEDTGPVRLELGSCVIYKNSNNSGVESTRMELGYTEAVLREAT